MPACRLVGSERLNVPLCPLRHLPTLHSYASTPAGSLAASIAADAKFRATKDGTLNFGGGCGWNTW
jgi:hypothetical protein